MQAHPFSHAACRDWLRRFSWKQFPIRLTVLSHFEHRDRKEDIEGDSDPDHIEGYGVSLTIDLLEPVASFEKIAGPVLPAQLREKVG